MKATEEQKKLLLLLLIGIIVAAPYFLLIRPQLDKSEAIRTEITALEQRRDVLEAYRLKMPEYQEALAEMHVKKNEFFARYPAELPQEATILFIDKTESSIPIMMKQVAFTADDLSKIYDKESALVYADVMEITSTEPLIEGLDGLKNTTTISFECSYDSFKKFLKYIEDYKSRLIIPTVSINYSEDTMMVSGQFMLIQYAVSGEGRERVISNEPFMRLGAPNIFYGP